VSAVACSTVGTGSQIAKSAYSWAKWGTPGLLQRSIVTPAEQWLGARAAPLQEQCREPIGRILCAIDAEVDTQIVCPLVDKATEFIWRMPGAKLISGLGSKACNITVRLVRGLKLPSQPTAGPSGARPAYYREV